MSNPDIQIAIFDDDSDLMRSYLKMFPMFGIEVKKSALTLAESKILIPQLPVTDIVAALIDGSIGGQVIIDMLADKVPHIKRVGFSADRKMNNTNLDLYKPMRPDELAAAIIQISKAK